MTGKNDSNCQRANKPGDRNRVIMRSIDVDTTDGEGPSRLDTSMLTNPIRDG